MNILLVGPIASGKGTQAQKLIEKYNLAHLEMGGLLRSITKEESPLGYKVKDFLDNGKLVTDEIVVEIVENYLQSIGKLDGILFDGFPRILSQAKFFEDFLRRKDLKIDIVLSLTLPKEEILSRILNRRTCEKCGKIYNVVTKPPKVEGVCDDCGGKLVTRSDETPEKTATRIAWFEKEVIPMINYYKEKGMVEEVDGNRPVEVIFEDIVSRLQKRGLINA
ncbi:MAG: nucleoside monophosphate kinase [Patescibacteria group bacterium]|nr:nucleoside monophosphate kinase [Patescibacteria group bacterium]